MHHAAQQLSSTPPQQSFYFLFICEICNRVRHGFTAPRRPLVRARGGIQHEPLNLKPLPRLRTPERKSKTLPALNPKTPNLLKPTQPQRRGWWRLGRHQVGVSGLGLGFRAWCLGFRASFSFSWKDARSAAEIL